MSDVAFIILFSVHMYSLTPPTLNDTYCLAGWFGLRKEFCPWLLGVCPVLQEYGNISYKIQTDTTRDTERHSTARETAKKTSPRAKKGPTIEDSSRTVVPVVSIDVPD